MAAVTELSATVGVQDACASLGVSRATYYRAVSPAQAAVSPANASGRVPHPRRLADAERQQVLDVLHSSRFRDRAPAEVVATLLDEGTYLASERTMYRLLAAESEDR